MTEKTNTVGEYTGEPAGNRLDKICGKSWPMANYSLLSFYLGRCCRADTGLVITRRRGRWYGPTSSSKKEKMRRRTRPGQLRKAFSVRRPVEPLIVGVRWPTTYVRVSFLEEDPKVFGEKPFARSILLRFRIVWLRCEAETVDVDSTFSLGCSLFTLSPPRKERPFFSWAKTCKRSLRFCHIAIRDWHLVPLPRGAWLSGPWSGGVGRSRTVPRDWPLLPTEDKRTHHRHHRRAKTAGLVQFSARRSEGSAAERTRPFRICSSYTCSFLEIGI